jgi:hypothetical protein
MYLMFSRLQEKLMSTPESLFLSQKIPQQAWGIGLNFAEKSENVNIGIYFFS